MECPHDHHRPVVHGRFDIDRSVLQLFAEVGGVEIVFMEYEIPVAQENIMVLCEAFAKR